ncbi:MAG: AAA family ATPase [Cyclobacteriaceae bacterium]|nr:AAA family ATPase [Cyclobacteriaceae bacterium]
MKIYLIGLPGCGKTTLAKQLAQQLRIPFIDLDAEIEKYVGQSVRIIFKQYGESFFRKQEAETLRQLSESNREFVMATGGGAPVFHNNMNYMNTTGITIFLDVATREITTRILNSNKEERPLLATLAPDELKDKIEFLRSQRVQFYSQAHHTLSGTFHANDLLAIVQALKREP